MPFRLLHSADWHLGAAFHRQDRAAEEEDRLDRLAELCREHRVDALVVAGDVFDVAMPSAEAEARFYRCARRCLEDAGVPSLVAIAGNHDSGARLAGPAALLGRLGLHLVGRFGPDEDPRRVLLDLPGRDGAPGILLAALPYLREADLRLEGDAEASPAMRSAASAARRYAEVLAAGEALAAGRPLVLAAHCFAAGGRLGGGERRMAGVDEADAHDVIGTLGRLRLDALAPRLAYAALGHLHRPQALGAPHLRYAGSLLPQAFDQADQAGAVALVELEPGRPARVQELRLPPYRRYRSLRSRLDGLERQLAALEPRQEGEPEPWLQVQVELGPGELAPPGCTARLQELAQVRGWNAVSTPALRLAAGGTAPAPAGPAELPDLDPETVFRRLHGEQLQAEPDAGLLALFRDLRRRAEAPPA